MYKKDSIAAVIVTYNRLVLLKKCIQSLREQTKKVDEIIVVNNSSTDGTLEWLNSQNDLTTITQENSGSAGGQHTGIKTAYEKGYNWIWCFDDDNIADTRALEYLTNYLDKNVVLNSLVISSDNSDELAFGLYEKKNGKYFNLLADIGELRIIESQNFFNGSLFSNSVLREVGFPLSELFIRGEEFEYYLRLLVKGFNVYTVVASRIYHPKEKKIILKTKVFYYEFSYLDAVKRYFHTRNLLFIARRYKLVSYKYYFKNFLLDIFFISVLQRKPSILINHIKGFFAGLVKSI
jgi:GT2 family glycosyltransferase